MIVIADSSALIALATCSALEILAGLYDEVYVPRSVYEEVSQPDKPNAVILSQFLQSRVVDVDKKKMLITVGGLGEGEIEAMTLYLQLSADRLLIDDRRARRVAEANKISCIGALGILLLAKHNSLIAEITPFVEQLRHAPLHYSEALLTKVQQLAGEL